MDDLRRELEKKLHRRPAPAARRGDFDLNPEWAPQDKAAPALTPAAVLVPLIDRAHGITMLLTQRTHEMPTHAGQISFPGGRVQVEDKTQTDAALREAFEEVGISPGDVAIAGFLDFYETRTRYRILPVVGIVSPDVKLTIDPREVDHVFEVPLAYLMDPAHHQKKSAEWQGALRHYYAMPYKHHHIWGATAGMIMSLYERLYAS